MHTIVHITNMFEKANYKKTDFSGLIFRVLLKIETRGQVFCTALGPVATYSIYPLQQLDYCIYFTIQSDILNA